MLNLESLTSIANKLLQKLSSLEWTAALLVRLFVGYFFFETGWAKLHNLDAFTARFMQWGIPHPAFNAALSAYTECIGGALTMAGLATRLVSIPMMINMAVAIITVRLKSVGGIDDFVELDEPLYGLVFFWLLMYGPGKISLDHLIRWAMSQFTNSTGEETRSREEQTAGFRANPDRALKASAVGSAPAEKS
jgi:putative oxidoreductase